MKKVKSKYLTLLMTILLFSASTLFAWPFGGGGGSSSTLIVDNTPTYGWFGWTKYSCENTSNPYSTIQGAVDHAGNGDTIKICKGDYNEKVTADKDNLTITNGSDATTPDDVNWYYNGDVLNIGDSSHTVKDIKIENISLHSTINSSNNKAIRMNYVKNNAIFQNLHIKTDGADGIYGEWNVNKNLHGIYKNLIIDSKGSGIYINKGKLQDFEDINFSLTQNNANDKAIVLKSGVLDENHIFKHLSFNLNAQPAIELSSGKKMDFEDINISAAGYGDTTNAISLDYSTMPDNLSFSDINITLNKGVGISIAKAKNITVQNIDIKGTTQYAFYTDSEVTENLSFDNINFLVNSNYGLWIKNGKNVTINKANFSGSSANGIALKTDWGVTGDFNFTDINISTHTGGIEISKGKKVSFDNVIVNSDSSSANDKGVKFDWSNFNKINIVNCEFNATGTALDISESTDLTVDNSKLTTSGDRAISINTNVKKMHLKNSCFHNLSTSGNSYAIYLNNWKNDLHINNNCIYAPNGGNYASDTKSHDWDENYWDGVTDSNGDGKISRDDTIKISLNIIDNNPSLSCQNNCGGVTPQPIPIANYQMDECQWNGTTGEVRDSSENGYDGTAKNDANTESNTTAGGGLCRVGKFDGSDDYIQNDNIYDALKGTASLSFWIKTTQTGDDTGWKAPGITGVERFGGDDDIFLGWIDANGHIGISKGNSYSNSKSNEVINDNQWHHIVLMRDSGNGNIKIYIDGESDKNGTTDSGVVGTSFQSIGRIEDTGGTPEYFQGEIDEVKVFDKLLTQLQISTIYNNEKDKKNYDGSERVCVNCNNEDNKTKNYKFDAWDTFRDINDRNISTKIVKQDFNLTIASLDENGTNYQEFNGTVCATVDNGTSKLQFLDQNSSVATFDILRAVKDVRVEISWKKNVSVNCPLTNEDNETNSTDDFAIRPEKFSIDFNTTTFQAGVSFHVELNATSFDGVNSNDYNETDGSSFAFDYNDTKPSCATGVLGNLPSPFKFYDGNISFDTNYSEVGDVNFSIKEVDKCVNRFAGVDCDDKNVTNHWNTDNNLPITSSSKKITVLPHHFEVNATLKNFYKVNNFTYLSKDLNMSATLDINIAAKNKQNVTTKNYNTLCYAKDIDINISTNKRADLPTMLYMYKDAQDNNNSIYNGDINITYTDGNFTTDNNGSSKIRFYINFDRNKSIAVNQFDLNITDINVTDENNTKEQNEKLDGNATFYYGRVKTADITTNKKDINNSLHVEVYSTSKLKDFHQESLSWYKNQDDDNTTIILLAPKKDFIYEDDNKTGITIDKNSSLRVDGSIANFNIQNTWNKTDSAYIHVKIPKYLWHSKYNDYNESGDCSEHPCFRYNYTVDTISNSIQSGDFNGTTIGKKYNATKTKKGVKVFR